MPFCWSFCNEVNGILFSYKFTIDEFIMNNALVSEKKTHPPRERVGDNTGLHIIYVHRTGRGCGS